MARISINAQEFNRIRPCWARLQALSRLIGIKARMLEISPQVSDMDRLISIVNMSCRTQDEKLSSLNALSEGLETFARDVTYADESVAQLINRLKEEFYEENPYLKPEIEKTGWEKFLDGVDSVADWCAKHWKLVLTVLLIAAAIVVILNPASSLFLLGIANGIVSGAFWGGLIGGAATFSPGNPSLRGLRTGRSPDRFGGILRRGKSRREHSRQLQLHRAR